MLFLAKKISKKHFNLWKYPPWTSWILFAVSSYLKYNRGIILRNNVMHLFQFALMCGLLSTQRSCSFLVGWSALIWKWSPDFYWPHPAPLAVFATSSPALQDAHSAHLYTSALLPRHLSADARPWLLLLSQPQKGRHFTGDLRLRRMWGQPWGSRNQW